MNAMGQRSDGPAVLRYGDNEFVVMRPGAYILCAVSGRHVPLDALRYWSVSQQEGYAGAAELKRAMDARGGRL